MMHFPRIPPTAAANQTAARKSAKQTRQRSIANLIPVTSISMLTSFIIGAIGTVRFFGNVAMMAS